MNCVNMLDNEKTEWKISKRTGNRIGINHYEFHPSRITESTLFKIPETRRGEILTYSGVKDPDEEFFSLCNKYKFKGITFDEIWSNE